MATTDARRELLTGQTLALGTCAAAVVAALALRALYLAQIWRVDQAEHPAFIAAEGVVGLMARHILAGERPVFYYGQYYMGALEAYGAALAFRLFGESMETLRAVPALFAVLWIPLAGALAARLFGRRAGWLAAALAALPPPFVFVWGFEARGGHAEHVTLTLAALLLCVRVLERATPGRLAALGFVVGLALWTNQLIAAYLPLFAWAVWTRTAGRRGALKPALAALALGAAPLLYGNVAEPLCTVRAMASKVRASYTFGARRTRVEEAPTSAEEKFYRAVPLFEVLGAQPRRDGVWSGAGTAAALALLAAAAAGVRRRNVAPAVADGRYLIAAAAGLTVLVGIGGFSGQPVGRYQLLLAPLLAVLGAGGLVGRLPRGAVPVTALLLAVQAGAILQPPPADHRTAPAVVLDALRAHGLSRGYGADNMYDLVFQSRETIIIEPLEWSRYGPYRRAVEAADRVFYLFREDQETKTSFRVFRDYLERTGVHYERLTVGEYRVWYDFSPRDRLSAAAVDGLREEIRRRKRGAPAE